VSKFRLNLLVEILKVLPKFQKSLKFNNIFSFEFPLRIRPSQLSFTMLAQLFRGPPFPSSVRFAHTRLWNIPQNTFSSLIHAFHPQHLLSLPSLTHGPACQLSLPPSAWRQRPRHCQTPSCPASLCRLAPCLEWPPSRLISPRHQGPSLTPLHLAPSSMLLKPLMPHITTPATPPQCSLDPYKRRLAPSALTITFSLLSPAPSHLPLPWH
jgi:hypothetical protein